MVPYDSKSDLPLALMWFWCKSEKNASYQDSQRNLSLILLVLTDLSTYFFSDLKKQKKPSEKEEKPTDIVEEVEKKIDAKYKKINCKK